MIRGTKPKRQRAGKLQATKERSQAEKANVDRWAESLAKDLAAGGEAEYGGCKVKVYHGSK